MAALVQWCFALMGSTKTVQPYCRLAIIAMQTTPATSCIHGSAVDAAATPGAAVASAAGVAALDNEAELSGWLAEAISKPPKGGDPVCSVNLFNNWTGNRGGIVSRLHP